MSVVPRFFRTFKMDVMFRFHFQAIVKEGYLLKSPPLDGFTSKVKRWQRRWFVLTNRSFDENDKDPIKLHYFKNKASFGKRERPKGKIGDLKIFYLIEFNFWSIFGYILEISCRGKGYRFFNFQRKSYGQLY